MNMCKPNEVEIKVEEYINYQTGEKLDLDKVTALPDNAMLKVRPELWVEWDFEKNNDLGFDIWKVTKGIGKKVWWVCKNDKSHKWDASIDKRSNGRGCPYCKGFKVNHTNSLITKNPELASQWHPKKNGELTPNDVTVNSHHKVWWLGTCGHEWEVAISNRNNGNTCPYCTNQKLLVGYNDMWTTNPELAKLLSNPEDGYRYMQKSEKKVDWKCLCCGEIVENKQISKISNNRIFCDKCSEGSKFPERIMYHLLEQLYVEFDYDKVKKWSNKKRYDFYISHLNLIIETHGIQHFERGFEDIGGRTLEEEQANDKYKYELAINNNVLHENYITIDCRKSDFEFIKNNILNSRLAEIFDLSKVNWENINYKSTKSLILAVCESYLKENKSTSYLVNKFNISKTTVRKYLKRGNEIGLINYKPANKRRIVQLSIDLKYIAEYNSLKSACEKLNVLSPPISCALRGVTKTSYGFKWMYLEDYEKLIK